MVIGLAFSGLKINSGKKIFNKIKISVAELELNVFIDCTL
jgi:hypothetical protein